METINSYGFFGPMAFDEVAALGFDEVTTYIYFYYGSAIAFY